MDIGFDISNNNVVKPIKKVIEPLNIVDTRNPPDSGGGNENNPNDNNEVDYDQDWSDWRNVIPNYNINLEAKEKYLAGLEKPTNLKFLSLGVLAYFLLS